ncbi:hypothetical protein FC756_15470 [Lysinibacillus mangiferihumi]|uniref:YcaO domain-containing protein n=1 Tax=Lysinibacillus mangiferihumi TaxID=1130819 RepID=A0A4U2YYN4_9BACI|nr:hypothetical protein [Lysinibacillus mangiferihumi]TKI66325.1 hypothetical protein FC756_15470 [Lysinibacillus mangiferihumi]
MKGKLEYLDKSTEEPIKFENFAGLTEENLTQLINFLLKEGKDIIIKDVTTSDIEQFGAKVTKTIIPGLQPMHLFEPKMSYSERLLNYCNSSLKTHQLNKHPHPFG